MLISEPIHFIIYGERHLISMQEDTYILIKRRQGKTEEDTNEAYLCWSVTTIGEQ